MTDNVALRGMMVDMFGDLRRQRRVTGSRGALPPPPPGVMVPDPNMAQGDRVEWAELFTVPMISIPVEAPDDPTKTKNVSGLTLKRGWASTEQGNASFQLTAERGGVTPNFRMRGAGQETLLPNYLNVIQNAERTES